MVVLVLVTVQMIHTISLETLVSEHQEVVIVPDEVFVEDCEYLRVVVEHLADLEVEEVALVGMVHHSLESVVLLILCHEFENDL